MSEEISKEELFNQFKENKVLKFSTIIVGVILGAVLIFMGYKQYIYGPKNEESKANVAKGILWMEKDSINLAIEEFEYIIEEYGSYEGAQIARYSLGNIYFEQGRYDDALVVLEDLKLEDTYLMTLAIGTMGDCYSELGDLESAVNMYIKAAKRIDNDITSPQFLFKAGLHAEEAGDYEKAKDYFQQIQDLYLSFANQKSIEKYIVRVDAKIK